MLEKFRLGRDAGARDGGRMAKTIPVAAIKSGTVIDHIPAGCALKILELLQFCDSENLVSIGLNLESTSMGKKDLIKIADRFLSEKEMHDIAIFAPRASISLIKNYRVALKKIATLPEVVEKILICPNSRCITNAESISTRFQVEEHRQSVRLQCQFCEKCFPREAIKEYRS